MDQQGAVAQIIPNFRSQDQRWREKPPRRGALRDLARMLVQVEPRSTAVPARECGHAAPHLCDSSPPHGFSARPRNRNGLCGFQTVVSGLMLRRRGVDSAGRRRRRWSDLEEH